MKINTNSRKFLLSILIAYGGVLWLNVWHQLGHNHGLISASPVLFWLRDSSIVLLPVMLAVWVAAAIIQRLSDRSNGGMPPLAHSLLSVGIMSILTSLPFIMIESNHSFRTGIGNGIAIQLSLCRRIPPATSFLLRTLLGIFPSPQAFRYHIFLQDGIYLALINVGISIFLILILEGFMRRKNSSFDLETI